MVLLSKDHSCVSFFKGGYTLLHQVVLTEHLAQLGYSSNVSDINWSPNAPSVLQVALNTGKTVSLEFALNANSFLISSILKVLKNILQPETFAKFL